MRTRLKLLALLTCLHAVVTLGATIYAMAASSAHFDNPEVPRTIGASAAATTASVLMAPGRFVWTSWASKNLPSVFEWALFIANSTLWGALGATLLQRLRKNPRGPLADEPGPSPWYLTALDGGDGAGRVLMWRPPGDGESTSSKRLLVDRAARALLLVDPYCWVRPLGASHLLVWHQTKRSAVERGLEASAVHIHVFHLAELCPLTDPERACQELDASSESVLWAGGHAGCYRASATQTPGIHHIDVPEFLRAAGELFLLVDAARPPDSPRMHLWILRPAAGTLEVLPQRWFNDGAFDVGYQWITRVAREPTSGRLVGEGIRLRPFSLDESGTGIKEYLRVNPFESGKGSRAPSSSR